MENDRLKETLSAGLFNGLKIKWKDSEVFGITTETTTDYDEMLYPLSTLLFTIDKSKLDPLTWKPVMFSAGLSDPIQMGDYNEGASFVPIEHIFEILSGDFDGNITGDIDEWTKDDFCGAVFKLPADIYEWPHKLVQQLDKWRINWRDVLVVTVTEENNPYK